VTQIATEVRIQLSLIDPPSKVGDRVKRRSSRPRARRVHRTATLRSIGLRLAVSSLRGRRTLRAAGRNVKLP